MSPALLPANSRTAFSEVSQTLTACLRANQCKLRADGWFARNGSYTLEQLDAEIARLQRLLISYNALKDLAEATPPKYPIDQPEAPDSAGRSKDDFKTTYVDIYGKMAAVNKYKEQIRNAKTPADVDTIKGNSAYTSALQDLATAQEKLGKVVEANRDYEAANTKFMTASLTGMSANVLFSEVQV